ncbi:hypothetical protein POM88_030624 [Heracleum sosnowskyi]|uniref:Uncharacterized protein n=1 Tax=Heracleum sosnowskyi TaxID=360622 RepID=A0AAD8MI89_9APIA|nr:hypothetical protein POM88_030624 [Heracleum sosnowskyi]
MYTLFKTLVCILVPCVKLEFDTNKNKYREHSPNPRRGRGRGLLGLHLLNLLHLLEDSLLFVDAHLSASLQTTLSAHYIQTHFSFWRDAKLKGVLPTKRATLSFLPNLNRPTDF